MSKVFNPPPNWPAPPAGWSPPPDWQPDPAWGPPPAGWQLWARPNPRAFGYAFGISATLAVLLTVISALGGGDVAYSAGRSLGWAVMTGTIAGSLAFWMPRRLTVGAIGGLVVGVGAGLLLLTSIGSAAGR